MAAPFDVGGSAALKLVETPAAKRRRKARVADLFCGAGGSSTGAKRALDRLGYDMDLLCINHWPTAIATHSANHPKAKHYCQDVATVRPHIVVPDGKLDLLMASPTCTYHSRARGGKPISDQQRMDPWHVITWLTELRVKRLLIENVPEFIDWGPVNPVTGKPIRSRKGEYFVRWWETMLGLGFKGDWRHLNAANYGDATTRERWFGILRSDGKQLRWPDPTHARVVNGEDLFGNELRPWRAAREIIDWSVKGRSIFNRKRPLSPNTLARICAGIQKFGWPEPFLVMLRQHMDAVGLDQPVPTLCAGGQHVALAQPFILNRHGDNGGTRAHGLGDPMPTADCRGAGYLIEPFVMSGHAGGAARSTDDPIPGMTGKNNGPLLVEPLIAPYYGSGSGESCSSTGKPLPTVTTKGRFGLVMPVTHGDASNRARSTEEPLPTITCAKRGELAFIAAAFGERKGQTPRVHSVDEPTPTICAQGRVQLVEPGRDFDILFRMLEPHELAAAMGFDSEEQAYEFTGTKTDVIKQIGNSVPVHTATALVDALMAH